MPTANSSDSESYAIADGLCGNPAREAERKSTASRSVFNRISIACEWRVEEWCDDDVLPLA